MEVILLKRLSNLYKNICNYENVEAAFLEVRKNTRNQRRVFNMKQYKSYYIYKVYEIVNNMEYSVGKYTKFVIHEPKERVIVSQNIICSLAKIYLQKIENIFKLKYTNIIKLYRLL